MLSTFLALFFSPFGTFFSFGGNADYVSSMKDDCRLSINYMNFSTAAPEACGFVFSIFFFQEKVLFCSNAHVWFADGEISP